MTKKVLKLVLVLVALVMIGVLSYKVITKVKEKDAIANSIKTIPDFDLITLNGNPYSNKSINKEFATVFIYFNSECDFCQHEAQSISDNIASFKKVQFIFVSSETVPAIKKFSEQYKLNNHQNITFLYDNLDTFSNRFGATSIPYMLIYDNDQQLIKKHKGQLNAESILRSLSQND